MGIVYKAEDTKLKRTVALKFLPPELTRDPEAKQRFVHEAQAASALDHNNICTIHEVDETEAGQIFICMAYYEGETLKEKIERSPLKLDEALDIAIQVAQGLDKAHKHGIAHRDIKPAKVMITQEVVAKILDFGLAKLTGQVGLTKTGTTVGTVAYMSPEQARGEEVDHRTDVWSLGVVLYEMLTGQLPFKGEYEQAVMYSILNEEPEPLTALRTGVPIDLEQIVSKALAKAPNERYQHADELLTDLRRVQKTLGTKPVRAVAGPRRRRWPASPFLWMVLIVLFGLGGGVLLFYPTETIPFSERDWILITDFENLTGDGVFDRSLNTALTVSIQQSRYVNVYPRSRVRETLQRMQQEKADTIDQALGREVALREGIKALVVPTISRIGSAYSLSASIVDPNSQVTLKTETAQAKGKDEILDALDDLAQRIRKDLGESLAAIAEQNVRLPRATTSSLEALKNFAEGSRAWDLGKHNEAVAFWNAAIELDSSFAWAHASLGGYYYWMNDRPKGEAHFAKALSLLDRLTERERLWIQASIQSDRGNREQAINTYKVYLAKYPDSRDAWYSLGIQYMFLRRYEEALEAYGKALEIDPFMASAYINIATCYGLARRYDEAISNYLKAFELRPEWVTSGNLNHEFGFTYVAMGQFEKARETFEKMLSKDDRSKARGHRSLALLDMYLGKYSSAIGQLKEAVLLNKASGAHVSEVRDRLYLATAYRAKGKMKKLFEQLDAVNKLRTETYLEPWWLLLAGKINARARRVEQAVQFLKDISTRINEENRSDRAAYTLLEGEIELARGNFRKAVSRLEMACKLREDGYTLESLAYGYLLSGDLDQALAKYEELMEKKDIGWEAQEYYFQAHTQLGRIYEQKGDIEKATQYYKRLLELWKEADSDLPAMLDVKARLAKLTQIPVK
jgi:serine/threonine protein kinase/Tfp pilus assembly protein PilF